MEVSKVIKKDIISGLSIEKLKEKFSVKDDNELVDVLTKIIINETHKINKEKCVDDDRWLLICLEKIVEIVSNNEKTKVPENLCHMADIKESLKVKGNTPKNIKQLYNHMGHILNIINSILTEGKECKELKETNADLYKFACKLIFEIKNIDYLFQISKTYPNLINSVSSENIPIIYYIIKRQIKNLRNGCSIYKKLYFDRVINIIMMCDDFSLTDRQIHIILDYLKNQLISLNQMENKNEELVLFINDITQRLKNKRKMTNTPQNIRDLFKKYHICILDSDYLKGNYNNKGLGTLKDYTDKNVITIDISNKVRIFDDAISCEILPNGNYLIGIYIADVSSMVPYGSPLDMISYDRAETIYLEDRVIDMLPLDLAYACSLNTEKDKRVIAYMFEFNKSMDLESFKIENAMIRVRKNLNFNTVKKLYLSNFKPQNYVGKILKDLIGFYEQFSSSNFYNIDYHILKDEMKKIENIKLHHDNSNQFNNLVASFMILVNHSIAKFFSENGYPFLYRINNSKFDEETIKQIKKSVSYKRLPEQLIKQIDKIYSRSRYSSDNTGHNGLNLDYYCHTTNPIRSYASLLTQRLTSYEFLNGGIPDKIMYDYEDKMPLIASHLNSQIDLDMSFADEYSKIHKQIKK